MKLDIMLFIAVVYSVALSLAMAIQCPTGSLPVQVAGEKLYSSTCDSQEGLDSLESLNNRVEAAIESVLPRINAILTPSPCDGPDWKRVVYIDMTNASHSCPANSEWQENTLNGMRVCRRPASSVDKCGEATFVVDNDIIGSYSMVCGKVIAYKYGTTEAFGKLSTENTNLDKEYVDGVSITHGRSPRHHIWTFAAGKASPLNQQEREHFVCPCDSTGTPLRPSYIGQNYFCENGGADLSEQLNSDNALWDGHGCSSDSSCCSFNNPPYFVATLDSATCENIDVRICASDTRDDEGTPIQVIELYVK
jgi:hypothetical protein